MCLKFIQSRFLKINRKRKLAFALRYIKEKQIESVLVVGAAAQPQRKSPVNLIEDGLSKCVSKFVVCGLERDSDYWQTWIQADGRALPFHDKEFDFVFSNAVIEHVGNEFDQIRFINEHVRVCKNWIITTPNRFFPIDSHTQVVFRHMSRDWQHPLVSRLLSK